MPHVPIPSAVAHVGVSGRREGAYGASTAASPESPGRIPVQGSATERPDLDGAATHAGEGREVQIEPYLSLGCPRSDHRACRWVGWLSAPPGSILSPGATSRS